MKRKDVLALQARRTLNTPGFRERHQARKVTPYMIPANEMSRTGRSTQTESRFLTALGWGVQLDNGLTAKGVCVSIEGNGMSGVRWW